MWKSIAGDYYRAYTWRGIREMWKTNTLSLVGMIYPLIVLFQTASSDEKIAFLIVHLSMMYILYSIYMHPVRLRKMMYLCPMESDRRRRYIRCSYYFGITVRMVVAAIGTGILMALYHCDVIAITEILLNDLAMSLLIPSGKKPEDGYGAFPKEMVCMSFMIGTSMLCNLISALVIADGEPHRTLEIVIFACIVLIQGPLVFRYRKYVRSELEGAVYYENNDTPAGNVGDL